VPSGPVSATSPPCSVIAVDFNNDGKLDVATGNSGQDSVSVLLGKGDGGLEPQVGIDIGGGPSAIFAIDLDGDGSLDLTATQPAGPGTEGNMGNVFLLPGKGDGSFSLSGSVACGAMPQAVTAGDINGDGVLDLVTANSGSNNVSVLLGKGGGAFVEQSTFPVGSGPSAIVLGDFNGDGKLDIVSAQPNVLNIALLLNTSP
jgi:hypothetical protein